LSADTAGSGNGSSIFWNNLGSASSPSVPVSFDDIELLINGNTFDYFFVLTNSEGCSRTSNAVTVHVISCTGIITLNVRLFIEGYYLTGNTGQMNNLGAGGCLFMNGISPNPSDADTVQITLMDKNDFHSVDSAYGILKTNGHVSCSFANTVMAGESYYLRIRHRSAIETWSASPVFLSAVTDYDFTTSQNQAYGNNMALTYDNLYWAFFSGDISDAQSNMTGIQDGVIESQDYSDMMNALFIVSTGYIPEDISGDGVVESLDYSIIENNAYLIISSMHP
jgi:hypothetical protein